MPQARQGPSGVESFASAGSKLEGTGLEKEQMGQIHVAEVCLGGGGSRGRLAELTLLDGVEEPDDGVSCLEPPRPNLIAFEYNVTLGEDLRKPA